MDKNEYSFFHKVTSKLAFKITDFSIVIVYGTYETLVRQKYATLQSNE